MGQLPGLMIQPPPGLRGAAHFLMLEAPGYMTQKGELVLTAPPGGQQGPRLPHCPPSVRPPWVAPKRSAWRPLPARSCSEAASVHSLHYPRCSGESWRNQVSALLRAPGSTSPTLFTSRGQKPERDHEHSAEDLRIAEPQGPGRVRERVAVRGVPPCSTDCVNV